IPITPNDSAVPDRFESRLSAERPWGLFGVIKRLFCGVQWLSPAHVVDTVSFPRGMNVNSIVRSEFRSKVKKSGRENKAFSGCAALLMSVMRPKLPLYSTNDPVDAETAKSPLLAGAAVQAVSPGWLQFQLVEIAPNCTSPEKWSRLPSINDARATVGINAATQHINVRVDVLYWFNPNPPDGKPV